MFMVHQYFPLTHSQKGVWSSEKLFPDTSMGNIAATLRLLTNVDYSLLGKAINLFIKENDAVRLRIVEMEGEPRQYVSEYRFHTFDFYDFSKDINELYRWDEKQTRISMEMIETDLFFFALVKVSDCEGGFYVKFHHLISDAWTMILLGNKVVEYYTALKKGLEIPDKKMPSFIDYLPSEEKYKETTRFLKDREYWSSKFQDWQEVTALKSRKGKTGLSRARRKTMLIPQKLTAKIHEYCLQKGVSEFSLFFAAVSMYINRVTEKEDLVLGSTFLNRSNSREKETAGMFANIAVPLRIHISDEMNFDTFVDIVSKEIVAILRHQKYPYDLILKEVRERNKTAVNLFDIVVTYQNSKFLKTENLESYVTRWHFNGHQIESLIINLNDRESDGRLIIDYDYLTDLFYATEIEFIHQHVINLLWHALDNPQKSISRLEMLSEKEKQKVLFKFNETETDYPQDKTIQELFAEQVKKTPNRTAVIFREISLTYGELNGKANQLARILRSKGVIGDSIVGIMLDRSPEMVIGIMGILKAGGAYLPIDPKYPEDRIKYMIEDCGVQIILTNGVTVGFTYKGTESIDLSDGKLYRGEKSDLEEISSPANLAYVIYTSGSTGNPKGVMIEHRSLVNRLHWMQKKYPLHENSVILQKTPFTFDVSVWELIWWSLTGARVCMLEPGGEKDPGVIIEAIKKYKITTMHFVPSMLSMFLHFLEGYDDIAALGSLEQVFSSGEALGLQQAVKFNALLNSIHGTELYNLYGPTEVAIDVSYFDCSPKVELNTVPIGSPIDNIKLYILDKHYNLLPIGIPGELFIGGVGVARGYMNKPELTQEKFVPNPFSRSERIYKTGDLVRWYAQGDIEYLGRLDHQIKIRGFRIELGEIENKLLMHPDIQETVVIGIEQPDKKFLCAYYISEQEIPGRNLKRFLASDLPEYMVPSFFVRMDAFPLSSNGKLDKKLLPLPVATDSEAVYAPPRNQIEQELVQAFQSVLEIDRVGIDHNFFELGGDSLSVLMIYSRIYEYNWGISAADFYSCPTIRELSNKIRRENFNSNRDEEPADLTGMEWGPEEENVGADRKMRHVLLTGATGFLGSHILKELVETTKSQIHCLVRGKNHSVAKDRLKQTMSFYFGHKYDALLDKRITCICGDIERENFGLSKKDYQALGLRIDTLIHSAAIVKYYGDYHQIEKVNVLGTKKVIDFALAFQAKLNHISTDAVTGNYMVNNNIHTQFTENDFYIGQNYMDNPYVRSKFEAENLVFQAVKKGLKANVFRMGNLTGRYLDGTFQPNIAENAFYSTIRSILTLGAVSDELLKEEIEFTPVDLAARAVTKILKTQQSDNRVFHILNHHTLEMKSLIEYFSDLGVRIQVLNNTEMASLVKYKVKDVSLRDALAGLLVYLNERGELAYSAKIRVNSERTVHYLQKLGFSWPQIDYDYISRLWIHMRETNFLGRDKEENYAVTK